MPLDFELPDGWEYQPLKDLFSEDGVFTDGDWVESKDQDPKGDVRLIQLADIGDGYYRNRSDRFLTYGKALELGCTFLKDGDILVARMPDPLGRACLFPGDRKKSVTVVDVCILRTTKVKHDWLMYAINSPQFRARIESKQSGSTRKRISRTNLANLNLPVPTIPQQERIVAKIDELFSQLDAGTAALKRVQAGLKRYKASVLKAAVEGKLVPQDPSDEPAEELLRRLGKKLLEGEGLPSLPSGWCWTNINDLAAKEKYSITDGPFGSNLKTEHYTSSGPRVIRLQNIGDSEFRNEKAHISHAHFEKLLKHRIQAGDLVIAGLGETLPRACIIPKYVGDAIVKADCIRFKPDNNLAETKYLLYALNSEPVRKLVAKIVHGIGRPRLNQQEIKSIPIPIAPISEQLRIIDEGERRLSLVTEVEKVVSALLSRSARLHQAILKQAFEGRL